VHSSRRALIRLYYITTARDEPSQLRYAGKAAFPPAANGNDIARRHFFVQKILRSGCPFKPACDKINM